MEHEFDKEMDGLLRGFGRGAESRSVPAGTHADADQLAAFLEGALPAAARANLIAHTSNCDECRALFAAAVDLHEVHVPADVPVAAPVFEPKRRWWHFLGTPAFAAALSGLLVVTFAGLIAVRYLSRASEDNIVAQKSADEGTMPAASAPDSPANAAAPTTQTQDQGLASNAQANSNAAAANTARRDENVPAIIPRSFAETPSDKTESDDLAKREAESQPRLMSQPKAAASEPSVAAAPKPEQKESLDREFQVDGASGKENVWVVDGRELKDAPTRAKSRPPAAADSKLRTQTTSPAATRVVSGKTFTQRDGIWYDSAYKGGKTTEVAKKCDTCGAMDPALEKIVSTLPGTVVVVWKGKNLKFN